MHTLVLIYRRTSAPLSLLYQEISRVSMDRAGYFEHLCQVDNSNYGVGVFKSSNIKSINCFINDLKRIFDLKIIGREHTKYLMIKEKKNGKNDIKNYR